MASWTPGHRVALPLKVRVARERRFKASAKRSILTKQLDMTVTVCKTSARREREEEEPAEIVSRFSAFSGLYLIVALRPVR